jgi:hypothetical protein
MGLFNLPNLTPDDEDQQKRPLIARPQPTGARPVGIAAPVQGPNPGVNIAAKLPDEKNPDPGMDLENRAARIPQQVGATMRGATQPDAIPPVQQRLGQENAELSRLRSTGSGISQIKNPWLRGGARALNTIGEIGSAVFPQIGTVLRAIPGTEEHHQQLIDQQERAIGQDTGQQEKEAQTAEAGARTEQAQAAAEKDRAQADAARNPKPEKPENLQQELADATQEAIIAGRNPSDDPKVKQISDVIQSLQREPNQPKPDAIEQQYQDAVEAGDTAKAERLLKVMGDVAKAKQAPQRPPQTTVVLPGGQVEVAKPGTVLPEGTQNIGGFAVQGRPTTQMRNVNAQAQVAAEGIPATIAEIDKLKDQMGPIAGRWNEFMQGKIGMENPEFAGLRADLLMLSSAVALAHARGRLPENLREEFDHAINAPQQNPENLKAVIQHVGTWMQRMQTMGANQPSGVGAGTLQPPKQADPGMKWQHRTANGKTEWRQVPQ